MAAPTLAQAKETDISDAEKGHDTQTLTIGTLSLETAKIAEDKAENPWVKRFAHYEVAEQTTIGEILKSMGAEPAKPSARPRPARHSCLVLSRSSR